MIESRRACEGKLREAVVAQRLLRDAGDCKCPACGARGLGGETCCPPNMGLESVYRARPAHMKFMTDLHYPEGPVEGMSDLERFRAAYGWDCTVSVHGPLPFFRPGRGAKGGESGGSANPGSKGQNGC